MGGRMAFSANFPATEYRKKAGRILEHTQKALNQSLHSTGWSVMSAHTITGPPYNRPRSWGSNLPLVLTAPKTVPGYGATEKTALDRGKPGMVRLTRTKLGFFCKRATFIVFLGPYGGVTLRFSSQNLVYRHFFSILSKTSRLATGSSLCCASRDADALRNGSAST